MTDHYEEKFLDILRIMRTASDEQLDEARARLREYIDPYLRNDRGNPAEGALVLFFISMGSELGRRGNILTALDADMMGGHRVRVELVDISPFMWQAACEPNPESDDYCWIGPERATLADAMEDGRLHNPGHEPCYDPDMSP